MTTETTNTPAAALPDEMVTRATEAIHALEYSTRWAAEKMAEAALTAAGVPGLLEAWQAMKDVADAATDISHAREEELAAEIISTKTELAALRAGIDTALNIEGYDDAHRIHEIADTVRRAAQDSETLRQRAYAVRYDANGFAAAITCNGVDALKLEVGAERNRGNAEQIAEMLQHHAEWTALTNQGKENAQTNETD